MAEEEENVETQEPGSDPEAAASADAADEGSDPTEAGESSDPTEDATAEAAPAEEPVPETDEAPEEPAAESEEAPAAAPVEPAEPEEVLSPKEARKRRRSIHSGEAGPTRSPEDRATQRVERRRANAQARSRRRSQERAKGGEPGQGTPASDREPGVRKTQLGTVVSDKADKTITVRVDIVRRHRRYEKVVRQSATVHAHDERNEASAGDLVRVVESRPLSRLKRWRLVEVIERAR